MTDLLVQIILICLIPSAVLFLVAGIYLYRKTKEPEDQ